MSPQEISGQLTDKFADGGGMDFLMAYSFIDVLEKFLVLAITIFTVYILILTPIIIILEIAYLCFPALRDVKRSLEVKFKGAGYAQTIFNFTFKDADRALEEANIVKTGKHPMLIYMRIKLWWIFLASITIYFQIIGATTVINLVLSAISGLLNMFK